MGVNVSPDVFQEKMSKLMEEYLGHLLTKEGIKPVLNKIQAVLDLQPPSKLKQLRSLLGIIQFYRDMWQRRSYILAPLTDLVGKGKKKINWRSEEHTSELQSPS